MPGLAVEKGDVEAIVVNTRRAGQTVTIRILRNSDKFFLDWSDNTFKTAGAVVTLTQALTEIDSVNAPGLYALATAPHTTGLNTGLLTNLTASALEELVVFPSATGVKLEAGRLKVVPLIDGVRPEREVISRMNAMARGKVTLSGAAVRPAQDAVYYEEDDATISYTTRNTGDERNPV